MNQVDRQYVETHEEEIIAAMRAGKLLVYPTDTIYGLGCDARNSEAVQKIRTLKRRTTKPFSVIAPGTEWFADSCVVPENKLALLPGAYTLITRWKEKNPLAPEINPMDSSIGIRIPEHWFTNVIIKAGVPFVSTSVNYAGEKHMEKLEDGPQEILDVVDYVVYEGPKAAEPSVKINLLDTNPQ